MIYKDEDIINYYGCVKCQDYHYEPEPIYQDHILSQSKHGLFKTTFRQYRHLLEIPEREV